MKGDRFVPVMTILLLIGVDKAGEGKKRATYGR